MTARSGARGVLAQPVRIFSAAKHFITTKSFVTVKSFAVALLVGISSFANVSLALAEDYSQPDIIGYSADFRYFAFEEFGLLDGSGNPYSSIYFIDITTGNWIENTPIKVVLDENVDPDPSLLLKARRLAQEQAHDLIEEMDIFWPAQILAYNSDGDPDLETDRLSLRFGNIGYSGGIIGDNLLSLEMIDTETELACESYSPIKPQGFILTLQDIFENTSLEIYRGNSWQGIDDCPWRYSINGVFAPFNSRDIASAVALISVYSLGFEGADQRFIVLPIGQFLEKN